MTPVLSQRYYLTKNHKQVTFRGDVLTEAWIREKIRSHTGKSLHPWNHWRQHTDQMKNMEYGRDSECSFLLNWLKILQSYELEQWTQLFRNYMTFHKWCRVFLLLLKVSQRDVIPLCYLFSLPFLNFCKKITFSETPLRSPLPPIVTLSCLVSIIDHNIQFWL